MRVISSVMVIALALTLLSGCGGGGESAASPPPPPPPETWTIFIYGHADHNLTPSLVADMLEMSEASIGSHLNVVVLADWDASASATGASHIPGLGGSFPQGAIWYKINGSTSPDPIEQLGFYGGVNFERNFDDPSLLASAVASAFAAYPADRYAVIMWDHGGSWDGGFGPDYQNTYIPGGGSHQGGMTINDLYNGIDAGLNASGLTNIHALDFLAFDTCVMGSSEVVAALYLLSETYIACAEIDYGKGWDYESTLSYISLHSTSSAQAVATAEVGHWNAHHASANPMDSYVRSHIALDCTKYDEYMNSVGDLRYALMFTSAITVPEFGRSIFNAAPGYSISGKVEVATPELRDMKSITDLILASSLPSGDSAKIAAADVNTVMAAMTLSLSRGSIRATQGGISIEAPVASQWLSRRSDYLTKASTWEAGTNWSSLHDAMEAASDHVGPVINATLSAGEVVFDSNDADQARAYIRMMVELPGVPGVYARTGLIGETETNPANFYSMTWDGTLPVIRNGGGTTLVSIEPWIDGAFYQVKGKLSISGNHISCTLLVVNDGTIAGVILEISPSIISVIPLSDLLPAVEFIPEIALWDSSDDSSTTFDGDPIVIGSGSPIVDWDAVPSGVYYFEIEMFDIWGNYDREQVGVTYTASR